MVTTVIVYLFREVRFCWSIFAKIFTMNFTHQIIIKYFLFLASRKPILDWIEELYTVPMQA